MAEDSDNFPNKYYLKPVYYAGGLGQSLKRAPVHVEHAPARDERTFEQYTGQDGFTVDVLFSAAPPLVGQLFATLKTTKTKTKTTKRKREQVCTNCRALHQ